MGVRDGEPGSLLQAGSTGDQERGAAAFADPWIVAGVALGAGVIVDTVALHQPPGLGTALGLWMAIAAVASSRPIVGLAVPRSVPGFAAVAFVLAGFVAIRSSPVLLTLDIGATVLLLAVLAQLRDGGDTARWTLARYLCHPFTVAADTVGHGIDFLDVDLRAAVPEERRRRARALGIGLAIGAPLVIVFAALFASADVTFAAHLERLTSGVSIGAALRRALGVATAAFVAAGIWRRARRDAPTAPQRPHVRRLEPASGVTVLAMLVVLFSLFVLTQVVGHDPELVSPLDFKQNARSGFFQLLAVAFLVLTVLLVFDWLTRSGDGTRVRPFDRLAVALIALTGVVMASAMHRMWLYVDERGLTELRFYPTVFMVWLGFVLVWFIAMVLRNRHARFAFGLLCSGLAVIAALNVVNPDALIVRFNWDRHLAGAGFGEMYNSTLSVDSIPELAWIVEHSPGERFCYVEERLARERVGLTEDRARTGVLGDSWSDLAARRALARLDDAVGEGC